MKACYPGTFDPITNGHLDIIARAAKIFEEVIVLIMVNPRKKSTFSVEKRKEMIERSLTVLKQTNNIKVMIGSGLTVAYAEKLKCHAIIRGIRAVSDYEYELQQATANRSLNDHIETLFLIARPAYSFLSSSVCKEIAINGGRLDDFIPQPIIKEVMQELGNGDQKKI